VLLALERRGRAFQGRTFWLFVLLYSVSRFIIEFYRGDDRGMPLAGLSTSQLISLVLFPLSLFMLWYLSRPSRPQAELPAKPRKPRFA
jgi:phosphatidylglycerol:prolipoprotein diacylglycerol transferase